jgi:hypothetical protein
MRLKMESLKLYKGIRTVLGYKAVVYVDSQILDLCPSREIKDYAPDCEWGYFGQGPSQLSLAILYDVTGDKDTSLLYCQDFKRDYIAQFDTDGFILLEFQIIQWLDQKLRDNEGA